MTELGKSIKAKIRRHREDTQDSLDLSLNTKMTPKCSDKTWMLLAFPLGNSFGGAGYLPLTPVFIADVSSVTGAILGSLGEPNSIMVF